MPVDLSDKKLVKAVRGSRSKSAFARLLGVSRPLIPQYEQGVITPSAGVWIRMARLAGYPQNISCWQRAGLNQREIGVLLNALQIEAEPRSQDAQERFKIREAFRQAHVLPEDATGPLGNEPVGGEPASLKGASKTVEEFFARNGVNAARATEESKAEAPPKKLKRERRRKK